MRAPDVASLLDAWERAAPLAAPERPLALLSISGEHDAVDALPIGERDRRLLLLREAVFGAQLTALTECPACREQAELVADLRDLIVEGPLERPVNHLFATGRTEICFRLPTSADVAAIGGLDDVNAARRVLLQRCIVSISHEGITDTSGELPEELASAVAERMAEADPQGRMELAVTCPACGHAWDAPFDIATFFWIELSSWAQRLLTDVHALARAYGWREPDVLALSAARRRFYIEMAAS